MTDSGQATDCIPEQQPLYDAAEATILSMFKRAADFDPESSRVFLRDILNQVHLLGVVGAAAFYFPAEYGDLRAQEYDKDKNGNLRKTIHNYELLLERTARYEKLRYNDFEKRVDLDGEPYTDAMESEILQFFEGSYGLKSERDFTHALRLVTRRRAYHPVRDKLKSLQWDGKEHIPFFLNRVMGTGDTAYSRECSRLIFHCGVARIMDPGCKVDDVVILQGRQGTAKSTLVRWLAMEDDWYAELTDIRHDKEVGEILQGKWIVELGELSAFAAGGVNAEEIKQFVSKGRDRYRVPYDKVAQDFLRQCIFVGTTNNLQPLTDRSGNRRFYPIRCNADGFEVYRREKEIRAEIARCWAEALHLWNEHKIRHSVDPNLLSVVRQQQQHAMTDDYRVGEIERYLQCENVNTVCVKQLWKEALGEPDNPRRSDSVAISAIMNQMDGWERSEQRISGGIYRGQSCWERKVIHHKDFDEIR
ncbi:MAG: hypothetical protein IKN72_12375 [Clostridia bacterium]|nr:hypothetical protein [Clostridia bacterium]